MASLELHSSYQTLVLKTPVWSIRCKRLPPNRIYIIKKKLGLKTNTHPTNPLNLPVFSAQEENLI